MTFFPPKTWAVGDGFTSAEANTYIRDNSNYFYNELQQLSDASVPFRGNDVARWGAQGNGLVVSVDRFSVSAVGTATARNVATTNALTLTRRLGYVTGVTAGIAAGIRNNVAQYTRLNRVEYECVLGFGVLPAARYRGSVGFFASTAAQPNTAYTSTTVYPNMAAFTFDDNETQWSFRHNDASGAPSTIALGMVIQVNRRYFARIIMDGDTDTISFYIENDQGVSEQGTITSDIPAIDTLLAWRANIINVAAVSYGIDLAQVIVVSFK